jgi:UPF0755 protein
MRGFFVFVLLAILAVGGWLTWALWLPVQPARQTFVLLHPGYSTHRIAKELQSAGVIRSATAFDLWQRLHRSHSLKAGEYHFEKPANALEVRDRLVRGDVYVHTVVIPEGYTIFDIAQAIQNAGLGSSDDFLKVASDTTLIADIAPGAKSLEGYLFPNTYEFTRSQSMQEMAAAMVRQFRQVAHEIGLAADVEQTVTLASIVEKETAVPEERPIVASVYYNRIAKRMPLQADPSVVYAEVAEGRYTGALHHADMQFESAYNTYAHAGLPPGPIGNPGRTSLEAAMHPATTDYLYFVSDGNGHHRFSSSLEEHNRNVVAYRRAINAR